MRFNATDIYDYYRPSECERRVALRARKEPEQETDSPFDKLLRNLGHLHEAAHLATFPAVVDLNPDAHDQPTRERLTLESIRANAPAIYQPRFRLEFPLDGAPFELIGEPDFLIRDPARRGYVIRDSKLARNIGSRRHLAIALQLKIYGFLFERLVGSPPLGLEVHAGTGEIVPVKSEGEEEVLKALRDHLRMRAVDPTRYEPVGWAKCNGCGFNARCWSEAADENDVAILPAVGQQRARALHDRGITSVSQIAPAVDDPAHRDFFWIGKKKSRHKSFLSILLKSAEAHTSGKPVPINDPPALPIARNYAMFDLEGLPPYADDLDRIYLWGMKVFGEKPSPYLPAQSGFGEQGDREGWFAFLELVARLFTEYGSDLPFIHWSPYEKTKVTDYINRYGDVALPAAAFPHPLPGALLPPLPAGEGRGEGAPLSSPIGVAAQLLTNLTDLLTITRSTYVLPLRSYSLKVVDQFVGYRRTLADANGAWSIAEYIKATETNDPAARAAIVNQILAYNEEDLDATWAVMEWLVSRAPSGIS